MKERVLRKNVFFDGKTVYFTIIAFIVIGLQIAVMIGKPSRKNQPVKEEELEMLLSSASELEEKGVYKGAIDIYSKYVELNPVLSKNSRAEIYFRMAKIAGNRIADYDEAQKYSIMVKNLAEPESSMFKDNQRLLVTWLERGGKSVDAVNELKNTEVTRQVKKGGTVIAEVNGNQIYQSEFDKAYEKIPKQVRSDMDKKAYLQQYVFRKLVTDAARRQKLSKDPELARQLNEIEEELLFKAYIEKETADARDIDPKDAENYYKANTGKFTSGKHREVKIVVLENKSDETDWGKAAKYKVTEGTGYISGLGKLQELTDKINSLSTGQTTEIVRSGEGGKLYQAKVLKVIPERLKPFQEVKNSVFQMYYREKLENEMKKIYEKLSESGDVKLYEDRLN